MKNPQANRSRLRKFDGVGQQVLQYLLQPFGVGLDGQGQVAIQLYMKFQPFLVGHVTEGTADVIA